MANKALEPSDEHKQEAGLNSRLLGPNSTPSNHFFSHLGIFTPHSTGMSFNTTGQRCHSTGLVCEARSLRRCLLLWHNLTARGPGWESCFGYGLILWTQRDGEQWFTYHFTQFCLENNKHEILNHNTVITKYKKDIHVKIGNINRQRSLNIVNRSLVFF